MFRQSVSRLRSALGQQRKLFLLVFLWTCLCLVIFKSSLFNGAPPISEPDLPVAAKLRARSSGWWPGAGASGSRGPFAGLELEPEFALPDQGNPSMVPLYLPSSGGPPAEAARPPPAGRQRDSMIATTTSDTTSKQKPSRSQPDQAHDDNKLHISNQPELMKHQQADLPHSKEYPKLINKRPIAGSQCSYDYPNLFDLQFNNIHWQKMSTRPTSSSRQPSSSNASQLASNYYLYNAYYDDRWRGGLPSVRILSMIDRIQPPPTNCLLWSAKVRAPPGPSAATGAPSQPPGRMVPLVTRASFVYAWYPKWGNYKDGLLQPWIVTCPIPRAHVGLVPDSVSLVEVPPELEPAELEGDEPELEPPEARRRRREAPQPEGASIAMPPSFSSSSPSVSSSSSSANSQSAARPSPPKGHEGMQTTSATTTTTTTTINYDCKKILPITNNLPIYNHRPSVKQKFAVCVKGLDFPHDDVSVRLVEWIELLNLLGAGKIFLYNLDVHENISKVLHYYQQRGMVELSPLTLPGDQPNLPEYQHLYLKNKLTAKRQNELIPYNDCLYRNLYSYQYLALLDIDEIIMPLKHHNWFELMQHVEQVSLAEQNYSRASYNVRNVYFFDDLAGPMGTTSSLPGEAPDSSPLESGIPHYLHMMQHVYRSKNYTEPGQYVKCFHNTDRVVSLHNHFPMNCFGQCTTYSIPVSHAHLQHYRKDCVGPLRQSCKKDFRVFTTRDTTIWKYKQQMIRRTTRVLSHLKLLQSKS